ncbi:MAG: 3-phosphoshikimate 1-carboxyvinyltransferase [Glaciecola sp.]|jgi:3-phosphoshikimate 1-carboxyvinyltransferase
MSDIAIRAEKKILSGSIKLTAGKSESNRVLLIRALCESSFEIKNLAIAKDTETMQRLLGSAGVVKDVGPAGTTMRFLTAFYAATPGEYLLTGSERMKNRPIKILVDALRELGADIEYTEKEGCPPLKIKGKTLNGGTVHMDGSVSSQYLSALIMVAPTLKGGLDIILEGKIASVPYLNMTLKLIALFGAEYSWEGNVISIKEGKYVPQNYVIEADWSGASYWYQIAALAQTAELKIIGLKKKSLQGDSAIVGIFEKLGVSTVFSDNGVTIKKDPDFHLPEKLVYDFSDCPDVAQTLASTVAGLGVEGHFTGLESLRIKETDRIQAIKNELSKFNIEVDILGDDEIIVKKGDLLETSEIIDTYDDHRVAMSIAPLCLLLEDDLKIEESEVVAKSYPDFWKDLNEVGLVSKVI